MSDHICKLIKIILIKDYQITLSDNQQIQETKVQKKAVPKRTALGKFI